MQSGGRRDWGWNLRWGSDGAPSPPNKRTINNPQYHHYRYSYQLYLLTSCAPQLTVQQTLLTPYTNLFIICGLFLWRSQRLGVMGWGRGDQSNRTHLLVEGTSIFHSWCASVSLSVATKSLQDPSPNGCLLLHSLLFHSPWHSSHPNYAVLGSALETPTSHSAYSSRPWSVFLLMWNSVFPHHLILGSLAFPSPVTNFL